MLTNTWILIAVKNTGFSLEDIKGTVKLYDIYLGLHADIHDTSSHISRKLYMLEMWKWNNVAVIKRNEIIM
jgi:hypothetical protein